MKGGSNRWRAVAKARVARATVCLALLGLTGVRGAHAASDPHGMLGAAQAGFTREPEDETPRMSAAELRGMLPDLKLRDSPPAVLFAPQFGMHIPYQVLGIGLGLELYPARWLRFGALYSFGFSPTQNDIKASHYAEASMGVAVFSSTSDSALDFTTRAIPHAAPVTLKSFVPAYHAVFVEGGGITGFFSPARCTANCDATNGTSKTLVGEDRQFILPFAGLRYVYYYRASSEHARFQNRTYLQVYAHVIGKPFNAPDHPIYSYKGDLLDRNSFGGRVGVEAPPPHFCIADAVLHTGCAQGGLALGYNPTPGFVFFEFHVAYLID